MKDTYISTALTAGVSTMWLEAQTGVRYKTMRRQLRFDQTRQAPLQCAGVQAGRRCEERVRELPSEYRRPLRHFLRAREAIEPRQQ